MILLPIWVNVFYIGNANHRIKEQEYVCKPNKSHSAIFPFIFPCKWFSSQQRYHFFLSWGGGGSNSSDRKMWFLCCALNHLHGNINGKIGGMTFIWLPDYACCPIKNQSTIDIDIGQTNFYGYTADCSRQEFHFLGTLFQ